MKFVYEKNKKEDRRSLNFIMREFMKLKKRNR